MLKNNNAPGSDLITAKVLKAGGKPKATMLHMIFLEIVNEENTPLYFSKRQVQPIFKKKRCLLKNYRAISLLSIPDKVLNKILLNKIREKIEVYNSDRQLGFRPNRGTIDAIFIVRQLVQKAKERGIKCHYHFVDLKSTFDTIWRKALWKIMRSIGMKKKIVYIVEKMHAKTACDVVVDGLLTERFSVSVSFREGCLLSPTLFNLFLDAVMDETKCLQIVLHLMRI